MVGLTKDAGWQIGVSRTVPHPLGEVWDLVSGPRGLALWLGESAELRAEKGHRYETAAGTVGEVRGYRERDRIRLTWRPEDWDHDTTVQVAMTDAGGGRTVLRFHQERLADAAERDRQREHWTAVLDTVLDALAGG